MTLADDLVEKGHTHANDIKEWVKEVDRCYKQFGERMEAYRKRLESALGLTQDVRHYDFMYSTCDVMISCVF